MNSGMQVFVDLHATHAYISGDERETKKSHSLHTCMDSGGVEAGVLLLSCAAKLRAYARVCM